LEEFLRRNSFKSIRSEEFLRRNAFASLQPGRIAKSAGEEKEKDRLAAGVNEKLKSKNAGHMQAPPPHAPGTMSY